MPISFSGIPADWKVPLFWSEIDSSMAGLPSQGLRALMVGVMTDGDAPPDVQQPIASQAQADERFGIGSEMSRMFKAYFANNFANEAWGIGVKAPTGAIAATGSVIVTTAPTEAGTIHLYVGAEHIPINVGSLETEEQIADAIADAINELEYLPVTAAGPMMPYVVTPPTLSGATVVGEQITVDDGEWGNEPTAFTYSWYRDGTQIAGETTATYTLADVDVGALIGATVTATNQKGSASANTDPIGPITSDVQPPVNSVPPVLSGAPTVGELLTVTAGTWSGTPTVAYEWKRDGVVIAGATAETYTVDAADDGAMIGVTVTATNSAGEDTADSNQVGPVSTALAPPANSVLPALSGLPVVGEVLTVTSGTWSGNPTYAYEWLRDGTPIVGETTETYAVAAADDTAMISVTVTATNAAGNDTADSNELGPVTLVMTQAARRRAGGRASARAPTEVTITCKWQGVSGNDIRISMNYYGRVGGEVTPLGLVLQLPPTGHLTGGVGVPSFTQAISNLGENPFEYVAMPYTDAASLRDWEQEFGFSDDGRWGWMRQLYGHLFAAYRGNYADILTFADTRNSGINSIMAVEPTSPSPVFEWAAAYAAKAQRGLSNDPARPLQTLGLNDIKLAQHDQRFIMSEINTFAHHGIATQMAGSDNQPMISRETTTYQLNLYGFPDDAYELVTTLATLAKVLRNQRAAITTKFPRHKLANDGTRFGPGQKVATPGTLKAEMIAQYRMDEFNGLVEDTRNFKKHLIVERDPNDPNRVNVLYPPDLINQLRIFAVLAQFRLQYSRGVDEDIAA